MLYDGGIRLLVRCGATTFISHRDWIMAPTHGLLKGTAFIFSACRGGGLDVCAAPMGMLAAGGPGVDMLASWAEGLGQGRAGVLSRECLRFAFYGRVSTEDWQDPVTSRARQLAQAVMLTAGQGVIAAEFFDAGRAGHWRGRAVRRPRRWWRRWRIRTVGGTRS